MAFKTETEATLRAGERSEERRVGKEWRTRGAPDHLKKKKKQGRTPGPRRSAVPVQPPRPFRGFPRADPCASSSDRGNSRTAYPHRPTGDCRAATRPPCW